MPQAVKYKLILAVQPVRHNNLIIYCLIFLLGVIFSKNAMQIRSVSAQSKCPCRTFHFTNCITVPYGTKNAHLLI